MIALDYNPAAQKIAEKGFSLAKAIGAEITLIHVMSDPLYYSSTQYSPIMGFGGYINKELLSLDKITELRNSSQHFLDKSKTHLGDKTIQTLVKEGDFAESILEAAKELRVDIIVIGSHSRRWLEEIVMGSVTEKVLHLASIPLFIIPTKKHK